MTLPAGTSKVDGGGRAEDSRPCTSRVPRKQLGVRNQIDPRLALCDTAGHGGLVSICAGDDHLVQRVFVAGL